MTSGETTGAARPLTPEDIERIILVSDAQIAPDGRHVAYVQTRLDREKNDYQSSLYIVPTDGGARVRYTAAGARDTFPRWSPSGDRLAFLSNRSGSSQLWAIPLAGGEATQLTDLPEPVTFFAWSPDGATIAFVSKTEAEQLRRQEESTCVETEAAPDEETDVVRLTRIRFRADGTPGFLDDKHSHVWCMPSTGGTPWQVTSGDFDDGWPAWSPSGRELAFASNRTPDREYNNVHELWAVNARGGEARPVLVGQQAMFGEPVWSPDGTAIAVVGHRDPVSGSATNANIWWVAASGGEPENRTAVLDRSAGNAVATDTGVEVSCGPAWLPDGSTILYQLSDWGSVHVYAVPVVSGEPRPVIAGDRCVSSFSVSADGSRLAFVAGDALNPGDVYVCDADGANERRLTAVNQEFFASVAVSAPEEIRFRSQAPDEAELQGWIMKPVGFMPGRRYPMVLEIHGGPHSMYGNAYFHEFQLLAAQGYVVLYTNPRGSQGYGETFTKYTLGAWGEKDFPDFMGAVDHVIGLGYVDPNRLGVTGGSYGGFSTNWVIGHTDRFKAAVTQRCLSNLWSFFGTSDIGFWFGAYEIGAMPWEDREPYLRLSPITYVDRMTTPLLILHSEQDYRCPIEQAEQLFVSLKALRREVEFVRFPDESHGLSRTGKPKHRVERLQHILGWFERHL